MTTFARMSTGSPAVGGAVGKVSIAHPEQGRLRHTDLRGLTGPPLSGEGLSEVGAEQGVELARVFEDRLRKIAASKLGPVKVMLVLVRLHKISIAQECDQCCLVVCIWLCPILDTHNLTFEYLDCKTLSTVHGPAHVPTSRP